MDNNSGGERDAQEGRGGAGGPEMQQQEPSLSIQLIPQDSDGQLQMGGGGRGERRGFVGTSANNFIRKTFAILQQKRFETIVSWAEEGEAEASSEVGVSSFKIHNVRAFEQVVLPQYFKHSNMSSFVRQLNMYNFHKVRGDRNQIEFQHQKFIKNRGDLLIEIRRKQVDSTTSIPSLALLPHEFPESQRMLQVQSKREASQAFILQQAESPEKRDSSLGRGSGQQQQGRLVELLEANRGLKKVRQAKAGQLRQLMTEGRTNMEHKFNKVMLALVASRIRQDLGGGKEQCEEGGVADMHRIIDHVMDSSAPRRFSEYLGESRRVFSGAGGGVVKTQSE